MVTDERIAAQLRRLEPTDAFLDHVRRHGGEIIAAGPFRALVSSDDNPWTNYALPVDPLGTRDSVVQGLDELRRIFAEYGHSLTVEFNEPLWRELPEILTAQGFQVTEQEPLLLCTPQDFQPLTNSAVDMAFVEANAPDEHVLAFQTIFSDILLEKKWRATQESIARFREEIARSGGRSHALAWLDGTPVGTGFITSTDGVCEITRVATIPAARRRGVAATLTTFMIQDRFQQGDALAWLTASGVPAQAVYQKLGFQLVGSRLYFRDES